MNESTINVINSCGGFEKLSCNLVYEVHSVMEIMVELLSAPHTPAQTVV
jgi:hypothetical protein